MKVYRDLTRSYSESAVALGDFDGLHKGHQKVISQAVECEKRGLVPTVLTFSGNTSKSLKGNADGVLMTTGSKISMLKHMGVKQLYIVPFSSIKDMTAEEFVKSVIAGICRAKEASCGFNFTFGRGGKADSSTLSKLCSRYGIVSNVAGAVLYGGIPVSSTRIRGLISDGRVEEAAELLGHPFFFASPVIRGRRIGHALGTPTANQKMPCGFIKPKYGVYVSRVHLSGKAYCGVTNIGVKPTVGSDGVLAETWMPDYTGEEIYGKTVRIDLIKFLRPERKFSGLEELRKQIIINAGQAKDYFRNMEE